jgi:hypothetical protein
MWQQKFFKTQNAMDNWIDTNSNNYQFSHIFVNNSFCIEYKPLIKIF